MKHERFSGLGSFENVKIKVRHVGEIPAPRHVGILIKCGKREREWCEYRGSDFNKYAKRGRLGEGATEARVCGGGRCILSSSKEE